MVIKCNCGKEVRVVPWGLPVPEIHKVHATHLEAIGFRSA